MTSSGHFPSLVPRHLTRELPAYTCYCEADEQPETEGQYERASSEFLLDPNLVGNRRIGIVSKVGCRPPCDPARLQTFDMNETIGAMRRNKALTMDGHWSLCRSSGGRSGVMKVTASIQNSPEPNVRSRGGWRFPEPISIGAVTAALLRSSCEPAVPSEAFVPSDVGHPRDVPADESPRQVDLSSTAKMRWMVGLALLSWGVVIAAVSLTGAYFR